MNLKTLAASLILINPLSGFAACKTEAAQFQKVFNQTGNHLAPVDGSNILFDVLNTKGEPQLTMYVPDNEEQALRELLSVPAPLEFRITGVPREKGGCEYSIGIVNVTPALTDVMEMTAS
jgi:hypothetical protein